MNINDIVSNLVTAFKDDKAVVSLAFKLDGNDYQFLQISVRSVENIEWYMPYVEVIPENKAVYIYDLTKKALEDNDVKKLLLLPDNFTSL